MRGPPLLRLAESIPGPEHRRAREAGESIGAVVDRLPLRAGTRRGSITTRPPSSTPTGSILGLYRKMHIPDDPLYYEKFYFTPGDTASVRGQTRHGQIGVLICWDQWFPEAARLTALQGAEILFYPTAIGWHPREKAAARLGAARLVGTDPAQPRGRQRLLRLPPIVSASRAARRRADGIEFWGQTFVAGPDGQVVARAGANAEGVVVADCDLDHVECIPHALAVPARPPRRRLRRHHETDGGPALTRHAPRPGPA